MKATVIKLDSTQFNSIKSKIDTIIKLNYDSVNHFSIANNTIFSTSYDDSQSWWLIILEYLIAPAFIVLFSVWLTGYISRNREYSRIMKLNDFINVWLNNIISGINEQIQIFAVLLETYKSIEFESPRNFAYANVDIRSVIEIPKADLHKLYISIRKGNETQKSQNFYNLFFALNSIEWRIRAN